MQALHDVHRPAVDVQQTELVWRLFALVPQVAWYLFAGFWLVLFS